MDNFLRSHDAAPVLVTAILFIPIAAIILGSRIATEWRKRHLGAMRSELTRAMVEAGMSADDIVRVLHAATEADEVVRVLQAAKGSSPDTAASFGGDRAKASSTDGYRLQAADLRR
jgi:hypothetical protein